MLNSLSFGNSVPNTVPGWLILKSLVRMAIARSAGQSAFARAGPNKRVSLRTNPRAIVSWYYIERH
jgi:hypothetical protein